MKTFTLKDYGASNPEPEYRIDYRRQLNERQHEAVMHQDGPVLVIAGAGTGKTRTLIYRLARLIEQHITPEELLLLTFTRRAAREMLDRAASMLDERCSRVKGGTFHSYCTSVLRRHAARIGFPEYFTILDPSDAIEAVQLVRSEMQDLKNLERFPRNNTLHAIFSTSVNKQLAIHETVERYYPQFVNHIARIEELANRYLDYKQQNQVMDFDDLLVYTRNLLRDNETVRREIASANRHVMIDEYQDTNALQAELANLFSSHYGNLMVVGDDAQSIYAFRGADHRNILAFPEQHPGTRIIKLEQNYRSSPQILQLANAIITQAREKFDKRLYTDNETGELPGLACAPNERDQSRFVVQMIMNLRENGTELRDIAVLFRSGRDSYDLESELNRRNIPFVKYGGQKFAEAAHIKDVLAHIRVLVNPQDALSWNRVLTLLEGVGPKTARQLVSWLQQAHHDYRLEESPVVSQLYKKRLYRLSALLQDLKRQNYRPAEVVEHVMSYYRSLCEKHYDDYPRRLKDLEAFAGLAHRYDSLDRMLNELALDPIEASAVDLEQYDNDEPPLTLSTIHSAKGLEWNTVFVIQCLDGIIPSGYAVGDAEQVDEELRLLYVACTRAARQLFITFPSLQHGPYGEYFANASRFIEELDEQVLEPWKLVEDTATR